MKYLYNAGDGIDPKVKEYVKIDAKLGGKIKDIMQFFNSNYNDLSLIGFGRALSEFGKAYSEYSKTRASWQSLGKMH